MRMEMLLYKHYSHQVCVATSQLVYELIISILSIALIIVNHNLQMYE